jgi:hypothetical protein
VERVEQVGAERQRGCAAAVTRYIQAVTMLRTMSRRLRLPGRKRGRKRGRILAVKWGLNPNSSSLGVDVTFLLFGAAALSLATPFISALIRLRKPALDTGAQAGDAHESTPAHPSRPHADE